MKVPVPKIEQTCCLTLTSPFISRTQASKINHMAVKEVTHSSWGSEKFHVELYLVFEKALGYVRTDFALNYTCVTSTVCCLCKLSSWLVLLVSQEISLRLLTLLPLAEGSGNSSPWRERHTQGDLRSVHQRKLVLCPDHTGQIYP